MKEYFLKTKRLGFMRWRQDDLPLAVSLWGDKDVCRYISQNGFFSFEEIQARLLKEINNDKQFAVQYWPVFLLDTKEFVGCCGLRLFGLRPAAVTDEYEIGVHLRRDFWGMGLAAEATLCVLDYAFDTLNATAVYAGHNPGNTNSKKVLDKLGFEFVSDFFYPPTGLMHPTYVKRRQSR